MLHLTAKNPDSTFEGGDPDILELESRKQFQCPITQLDNDNVDEVVADINVRGIVTGLLEGVPSGDFLLVQDLGGRVVAVLGDVMGKGFTVDPTGKDSNVDPFCIARLAIKLRDRITSICRSDAKEILSSDKPAVTVARKITQLAKRYFNGTDRLVDCAIVVIESPTPETVETSAQIGSKFHVCIGGSLGVYKFSQEYGLEHLGESETRGPPFPLSEYVGDYTEIRGQLQLGQSLILFTDGFLDDTTDINAAKGVIAPVDESSENNPVEALENHLMNTNGTPREDDTSILVISRRKPPSPRL